MAFNKGLELNDGNTVVRDTIILGGQSQALFQTQLVDGALQAHGATVFTIRPDDNDDVAGEYQSLLVGQNFAIGLEYNADGDQYRIVIQSRDDYDTGAGTENPAYGPFVTTETEITFGINLNDNGTITYMHTGYGQQSLSIPAFTPASATQTLNETTAPTAATNVHHVILDDRRGNIVDVEAVIGTTTAGDLIAALYNAFDALTTEQKSGFTMTDPTGGTSLTVARADGAGFIVRKGENLSDGFLDDGAGNDLFDDEMVDASGAPDYLFDLDFDGFVSQVATFNEPLTFSELARYVNQPGTIPSTEVNADGEDAVALITFGVMAGNAETYELILDDDNGHRLTLSTTDDTSTATIIAGLKADWTAATDKQGFTLDDSVADQLSISRVDGADFSVNSGASNYADGAEMFVNGIELDSSATTAIPGTTSAEVYTSKSIVTSSIELAETAALTTSGNAGVTYEIVLAGGDDTLTVNAFLPSGSTTADDALSAILAAAGGAGTYEGFTFGAVSSNALPISRADGHNFTIKLGSNDEADNLSVGSDELASDSTISSTNGVRSGVPDIISNEVVQNFDFTELDGAETVVGQADDNYAGEDTLIIYGMDKSVGPHASTVAALGSTNGYEGVDSSSYTGTVVVSEEGAVASDVLFTQLREVEDSGVANRQFTADVFIDPKLITDGDFSALSYTVGWNTDLTYKSITQADSSGGFKLEDIDVTNDTADLRWFKPTAVTDFSAPIATLVFTDTSGSTDPTLTFSAVDIDGTDFTDGTTYTASFSDTLDANLWDLGDVLVNGNDSTTPVSDQLVVVEGAPGGSSAAPAPTSGLYLKLDAYDQDASADAPNVDYTLGVYSSTATNTVSFEIDLPALADTSADDLGVNATTFTLDAALTDWTVTSAEVQGRTLVVEASGTTSLSVGDSIGQVSTTVINGFDTTQYFEMANVQTGGAANQNGRGLYVAATRTDTDGTWSVNDMPTGIMTRQYVGTAEIQPQLSVTAFDAFHALQISAGLKPDWWDDVFSEGQALAADFDGLGKVTAADALAILQYSVGIVPDPDPLQWVFFDSETAGITDATTVGNIASLTANTDVTESDLTLDQGDEVVLVGDLSNPAV